MLSLLPSLLPESEKKLKSPQDGLAALSHTILSALAFRLTGIDDTSTTSNSTNNVLPDGWNNRGPGSYTFRYKHDQSSLDFLIKVSSLGTRLLFNAIATQVGDLFSLVEFFSYDIVLRARKLPLLTSQRMISYLRLRSPMKSTQAPNLWSTVTSLLLVSRTLFLSTS